MMSGEPFGRLPVFVEIFIRSAACRAYQLLCGGHSGLRGDGLRKRRSLEDLEP
jgi:hypothetical protein